MSKGIDVIFYKDPIDQPSVITKSALRADYALLLVSNKWANTSPKLSDELRYLATIKRERNYIYALATQSLESNIQDYVHRYVHDIRILAKGTGTLTVGQLAYEFTNNLTAAIVPDSENSFDQSEEQPLTLNSEISRIWTQDAIAFSLDEDLADLYWVRSQYHFRHFPVVDSARKLIGIVSLRDLMEQERPDPEVLAYIRLLQEKDKQTTSESVTYATYKPNLVKDVMTSGRLITVQSGEEIRQAITLLVTRHSFKAGKRRISALPVVDQQGRLEGIVTYIDILEKFPMPSGLVGNFMTRKDLKCVYCNNPLKVALAQMQDVRDLLVLDNEHEKNLVGMVSEYEVFKNDHRDYPMTKIAPVELIMKRFEPWGELPRIYAHSDIKSVIRILLEHPTVSAIGVFDTDKQKPAGVISYVDILKKLLDMPQNGAQQ